MTRWEYCVLKGADDSPHYFNPDHPRLMFFTLEGIDTGVDLSEKAALSRPEAWRKVSEAGYVAHTIAGLGQEGWELVSVVAMTKASYAATTNLYFRRPIEDK